jgi:hypothetical protein
MNSRRTPSDSGAAAEMAVQPSRIPQSSHRRESLRLHLRVTRGLLDLLAISRANAVAPAFPRNGRPS